MLFTVIADDQRRYLTTLKPQLKQNTSVWWRSV